MENFEPSLSKNLDSSFSSFIDEKFSNFNPAHVSGASTSAGPLQHRSGGRGAAG